MNEVFYLAKVDRLEKVPNRSPAFPQLKQLRIMGCPLLKSLQNGGEVEWEDDNSRSHFNQFFNCIDDESLFHGCSSRFSIDWRNLNRILVILDLIPIRFSY